MQPVIKKQLVKIFREKMKSNFPDFMPHKIPKTPVYVWRHLIAPDLCFFVTLHTFPRKDIFVLEIAWSDDGEFHFDLFKSSVEIDKSIWRLRLSRLWKPTGFDDVWDLTPEVSAADEAYLESLGTDDTFVRPSPPTHVVIISRIPALVDDALNKFKQYALPLFNKVAMHRGHGTPFEEV